MNDAVRAAIMATATSLLNMLVLVDAVHLDEVQLGGINLFIGNAVILIALFFKSGQGSAPPPASMVVGEDPAQSAIRKASE